MAQGDKIFNGVASRFQRNIYQSNKGKVRLHVLWNHMQASIPLLKDGKNATDVSILDAGGGMGQMSIRIANLGYSVDLVEPSTEMLQLAKEQIQAANLEQRITLIHSTVQDLVSSTDKQYDLILFHAVLEWLGQPKETLKTLLTLLQPGGTLSLSFYNRNSAIMRTVLRGNFFRAKDLDGTFQFGTKKNLTPQNPLEESDVRSWLLENNMHIQSKCGVRIFNDYLHQPVSEEELDKLIAVETDFCQTEPFCSLGRYIHLVCKKVP